MILRMTTAIAAILLLLSDSQFVFAQRITSHVFSTQYVIEIKDKDLMASPDWSANDENPPLSARKAISIATKLKGKLIKDTDDIKWTIGQASLVPAKDSKWYWLIYFDPVPQRPFSGNIQSLRLVVLMDGTAIEPIVRNRRD